MENEEEEIVPVKNIRLVGKTYCFWHNSDGIPRITITKHWYAAIPITILVVFLNFAYVSLIINQFSGQILPFYLPVFGMAVAVLGDSAFLMTLLGN